MNLKSTRISILPQLIEMALRPTVKTMVHKLNKSAVGRDKETRNRPPALLAALWGSGLVPCIKSAGCPGPREASLRAPHLFLSGKEGCQWLCSAPTLLAPVVSSKVHAGGSLVSPCPIASHQ